MIIIMLLIMLLSGIEFVFCSESVVQNVQVAFETLTPKSLFYAPQELVDSCNTIGIQCSYNTPFLSLTETLGDYITNLSSTDVTNALTILTITKEQYDKAIEQITVKESMPRVIQNLKALPINVLANKNKGDVICSISSLKSTTINLICKQEKVDSGLQQVIDFFRNEPNYWEVPPGWFSKMINYLYRHIPQWLLEQKILEKTSDGTIIHGPEGYFKEEYAKKKLEKEQDQLLKEHAQWKKSLWIKIPVIFVILVMFKAYCGKTLDTFFQNMFVL
jgi:hypothetical protein